MDAKNTHMLTNLLEGPTSTSNNGTHHHKLNLYTTFMSMRNGVQNCIGLVLSFMVPFGYL